MAVITRKQAGLPPSPAPRVDPARKTRTFLHHGVTPQWVGVQAAVNYYRIARGRGFSDISYSHLADRQGNEIEGRGWNRVGGHTRGYNVSAEAICLVGNFDVDVVPGPMIRGAGSLARKSRPKRVTDAHRDVSSTACPGGHGVAAIPRINASTPTPTPPPPDEEDVLMKRNHPDRAQVTVLQWRLNLYFNDNKNTGMTVDGIYGPETEGYVKRFQGKCGYHKTGVMDWMTYQRLQELLIGRGHFGIRS